MNGGGYLGCEPVRRWLQSDQFLDEPVYCEATHDPDDVLYVGSDDDEYSNPTERQERIEAKAQRFLAGKPISIFSASLQGPFTRKSGWVNPWRSKSAVRKSVRRKPPPRKRLPGDLKKIALNYDGYVRSDDVSTPQSNVAHVEDVPTQEMTDDEDDTFVRIRDWRERVLSEIHVNVSPARTQPTQTEPFSTHPKSAVIEDLQRDAESSGLSSPPGSDIPDAPSHIDITGDFTISSPKLEPPPPEPAPQQSQREPALLPEDTTDPSPHALRIYEESVWNKSLRLPDDETLDQTPLPESSLERGAHVPGSSEERTPQDTTQNVAPITISDKVLASTQEDGSFLFRRARKEAPGPRLRRGRSSKLAPDMGDATEDQMQDRVSGPGTPQQHMSATEEENETTETPAPELAPGSYEPSQDEALPEQKEASSPVTTQEATAQDIQQKSPAPIPSQVDETTLVAPESSSSSEHLSLGNFSCERGSQDITSTVLGFPKRLLWPKAESSNEGRASEPNFGLDSTRPLSKSKSPEPSTWRFNSSAALPERLLSSMTESQSPVKQTPMRQTSRSPENQDSDSDDEIVIDIEAMVRGVATPYVPTPCVGTPFGAGFFGAVSSAPITVAATPFAAQFSTSTPSEVIALSPMEMIAAQAVDGLRAVQDALEQPSPTTARSAIPGSHMEEIASQAADGLEAIQDALEQSSPGPTKPVVTSSPSESIADKAADGLRAIQNALEQPSTCRSPVAPSPKEMIVAQASQGLKDLQDALERPSPDKLADSIVVGGELAGSETASESEIEDEIVVNTQDRPGEQVGEENEIVVSTQHNPVDDDVQEKEEPPHEAAAMECDAPEPEASPLEPPPAVQSPWATDTRPFPPNTDTRSPLVNRATAAVASETSQSQDVQSPWARGDSQLAAVSIPAPEIRSFVPFSSPANSAVLPILRPETPPPQSQAEVLAEGSNEPQSSIAQLSTPDSSQPTPESNLKSFRDFMTPSPPAAKRRRIISTDTDGRLPSTQLFVDAAVSNPWSASHLHSSATRFPSSLPKSTTAASGKRKRVSFAPLPGDPNFFVGSSPSSSGIISTPVISKPNHRAASPPPPPSSALSETTNSSTAETKFQKHFTRMVSRSRYSMGSVTSTSRTPSTGSRTPIMSRTTATTTPLLRKAVSRNLLPTESQQTCASPAVDAMAEAFLAADHPVGHSDPAGEREDKSPSGSSFASGGVDGEMEMDMSPVMAKGLSLGGETQEEDDVTEVLSNLDDFLGGNLLDLETETPLGREENQRRSLGAGSFGFGGFEDVEANVWDQP